MTEMGRREFIKLSLAAGTLLAAGEVTKGKVMADDTSKIMEVDKLTIWVLTDNYFDTIRPDSKITKRYRIIPGKSIHAEHGLAYYVETVVQGKASTCMFDYGLDPVGIMNNISLLGLDLSKTTAFGLSHGHFDHFMAAVEILKKRGDKIAKGTPFYVGQETFGHRYAIRPGGTELDDLGQLNREEIEGLGFKVVEVNLPTQIIPGGYFTGN
ncbi:MAG TPA: hypothetical protein VK564_13330, partial [Thermodesulfobacteriota bacterium]|nr:hypothetical protein [Thermodesulfobacteriota bacterium]